MQRRLRAYANGHRGWRCEVCVSRGLYRASAQALMEPHSLSFLFFENPAPCNFLPFVGNIPDLSSLVEIKRCVRPKHLAISYSWYPNIPILETIALPC